MPTRNTEGEVMFTHSAIGDRMIMVCLESHTRVCFERELKFGVRDRFSWRVLSRTTQDVQQNSVWGYNIKPQIAEWCPEDWTFDISYPDQEQNIQRAYVMFTHLGTNGLHIDTWYHLYNLGRQVSDKSGLEGTICKPVNPDSEGIQFLRMMPREGSPGVFKRLQRRFCSVLLYYLLGKWNYAVYPVFPRTGMVENWRFCPEGSNVFLEHPDCKVAAADCLYLLPPRTLESERPTTSHYLKMSHTLKVVDNLERALGILKTNQVQEACFDDVVGDIYREMICRATDNSQGLAGAYRTSRSIISRVSQQFKTAMTDLQTAINGLSVTVNDNDLENILEHATNCLEQTSGIAVVVGGGVWLLITIPFLGAAAVIGGALACVGAGYLYWKSDYLKKRVRTLITPLHRVWFYVRLLYARRNGIVDERNDQLADFARVMEEKYEISVLQDWMHPTYAATFLSKEMDGVSSVVVEINGPRALEGILDR
ncbi:hypothetical protein N7522_011926 [Penicillium canescens]|nr:hypothetical protein N7522_011926 [Penicillium canescens]